MTRHAPRLPHSPRQQHALPTSSCDLHAAPALPLLGDSFQQPFCRGLAVRARAGAERTPCRSQTFQAAHALRRSALTVRARPSLTEHVAPRGARRVAGAPRPAIGCVAHVTPRRPPHTHTTSPSPCPRKHPRQILNASRGVHDSERVGTNGARGKRGACAYLPGGRESTHTAPLRGPGTVALPDHSAGHWPPGRVTCCSQARPQPLITWHRARSGTESGLHAQGERGH